MCFKCWGTLMRCSLHMPSHIVIDPLHFMPQAPSILSIKPKTEKSSRSLGAMDELRLRSCCGLRWMTHVSPMTSLSIACLKLQSHTCHCQGLKVRIATPFKQAAPTILGPRRLGLQQPAVRAKLRWKDAWCCLCNLYIRYCMVFTRNGGWKRRMEHVLYLRYCYLDENYDIRFRVQSSLDQVHKIFSSGCILNWTP